MTEKTKRKLYNQQLALLMAVNCVRNTVIENYHCGIIPSSKTGDYTDVKVVTPYGEIPWNELSRINDEEMKAFNKEVADKLYTFLEYEYNPDYDQQKKSFLERMQFMFPFNWDIPKINKPMIKGLERQNKL